MGTRIGTKPSLIETIGRRVFRDVYQHHMPKARVDPCRRVFPLPRRALASRLELRGAAELAADDDPLTGVHHPVLSDADKKAGDAVPKIRHAFG